MWVVIAWREQVLEPVEGTGRADLGQRPRMMPQWQPRAAVWASPDGADSLCSEDSLHSARRHVGQFHGGAVYQYPANEPDPIGRAKRDVMAT